MVFVHVRNSDGRAVPGVHLVVTGAASRDVTSDFEGIVRLQMADGAYQLRFEQEGFVSLEKELTLRNGMPDVVNVTLNAVPPPPAPPPPAEPPPPPPPPPPPQPPPQATPTAAELDAEFKTVAVPDFVSKNFIGKEAIKESTLGCTPSSTTRLLQVRSSIADHSHADVDEVLYVVAGEGTLTASNRPAVTIGPGSLTVVPRGLSHAVERRGRNPLILLSMTSGAPCEPEPATIAKDK